MSVTCDPTALPVGGSHLMSAVLVVQYYSGDSDLRGNFKNSSVVFSGGHFPELKGEETHHKLRDRGFKDLPGPRQQQREDSAVHIVIHYEDNSV